MFANTKKLMSVSCLLLAAAATLAGCAQEREPIDRVQPYALEKSYFIGNNFSDTRDDPEFFARTSMLDVPFGAQGTLINNLTTGPQRVKWQITETHLIARLAYERISGSDGRGEPKLDKNGTAIGKETQDGIIVAMFSISKHFDVVYAYNSSTGEKLNIKEENASDRPWFERQYMRVDWSKNLNVDSYDFDVLSMIGMADGMTWEPLSYQITDPKDPNAPYFDTDGEGYFDVTTKVFARPNDLHISMFDMDAPACAFATTLIQGGTWPSGNCNPHELTLRHAFLKVKETDYEPLEAKTDAQSLYGAITIERHGFKRPYGMTDDLWYRFKHLYNIWERSHYYDDPETMSGWIPCGTPETTPPGADPDRDVQGNGTADECEEVTTLTTFGGSRCDKFKQRCTLPYQARAVKPMAWYFAEEGNLFYWSTTELAVNGWDTVFRNVVQTAKYSECMRVEAADCGPKRADSTCWDDASAKCVTAFPVWFGQMDDNEDAVRLVSEVDDCRHGVAYKELNRVEASCVALADSIGKKRGYSAGVIATAKMPEAVVLCHSPAWANDPAPCAGQDERLPAGMVFADCVAAWNIPAADRDGEDEALVASCDNAHRIRRADLLHHKVNPITEPNSRGYWGVMYMTPDPLTGETIASSANVFTAVTDRASQGIIDQIRLAKGELEPQDITEADYVFKWRQALDGASKGGAFGTMSRTEMAGRISKLSDTGLDPKVIEQGMVNASFADPKKPFVLSATTKKALTMAFSAEAPNTMEATYDTRRQSAFGSDFEAALMTPAALQAYGISENTSELAKLFSPLRLGNPDFQAKMKQKLYRNLAARGIDVVEYDASVAAPLSLPSFANRLEDKFATMYGKFNRNDPMAKQLKRAEAMRQYVALQMNYAVIGHEMGHAVGLEHNFVSSADPWSYRPQYWQLRTVDGTVTDECLNKVENGEDCVGPRYFDPITENERQNLIYTFQQGSIMDYPGEVTQDFLFASNYDWAAMRMFYSGTMTVFRNLSVFDKPSEEDVVPAKDAMDKAAVGFGGMIGIINFSNNEPAHYTKLQAEFKMVDNCEPVNPADFKPGRYDEATMGAFDPVLDALIVDADGDGTYTRCRTPEVDFVDWDYSMQAPEEDDKYKPQLDFGRTFKIYDKQGRPRMPYAFANDNWVNTGNASVWWHDNGADLYEIFNFFVTSKEMNHIFDGYRRGNTAFSAWGSYGNVLGRYNNKLRDGAKGIAMYKQMYKATSTAGGMNPEINWDDTLYRAGYFFGAPFLASTMSFDYFTRELSRPQAGVHGFNDNGDPVARSLDDPTDNAMLSGSFIVPNGATGKYNMVSPGGALLENRLADNQGDYATDYMMNAGSYYDKMWAAMHFTESADNFISQSRGDFYDARYRSLSLAELFPGGYKRMLATMLTNDETMKGTWAAANDDGTPILDADDTLKDGIGWTTWSGNEVGVCFPANGTNMCRVPGMINDSEFGATLPANMIPIDGNVGFEQQKFLVAWTLLYLPESQLSEWLDTLRIWELGRDADPEFGNRIELHYPSGRTYVAKTEGREKVFGKLVQRGVAARMLEYANSLLAQAYDVKAIDKEGDGLVDWYEPILDKSGQPRVKFDSSVTPLADATCSPTDNSGCVCGDNKACAKLSRYITVPAFMRQAMDSYGYPQPDPRGIYY